MLHIYLAAGETLSVDNPLVLGPIAAFVFIIFVTEVIVSGKAYRREVEENKRLRLLVEKVVPLAEALVVATKDVIAAMIKLATNQENLLEYMKRRDEDDRRSR
jgi:hypothetical protein